jgi:hypothetical protein
MKNKYCKLKKKITTPKSSYNLNYKPKMVKMSYGISIIKLRKKKEVK